MIDLAYYTSEATTLLNSLIGIPSLSREEEAAAAVSYTHLTLPTNSRV